MQSKKLKSKKSTKAPPEKHECIYTKQANQCVLLLNKEKKTFFAKLENKDNVDKK